jgi:hypothetical protein
MSSSRPAASTTGDPSATRSSLDPLGTTSIAGGDATWRFAGTLLLPPDPNVYANVLLDAEPLADGGWIVVQDREPVRRLPNRGAFSAIPFRPAHGIVMRLDAGGHVVARQSDELYGPTHVIVYERSGVVVAEGSGTRGLDLRTLDTLWTGDAECVSVDDRCYAYLPVVVPPPGYVDERDVRTFRVVHHYPHIAVGQLRTPMIMPRQNLVIVGVFGPDRSYDFFPLDPTAPISLSWIDTLRTARSITLLSPSRMVVSYEGWANGYPASDLVDIDTGHVVAHITDRLPMFATASTTFLQGPLTGQIVDPQDGSVGPVFPTNPLYVSIEKGIVVLPLGNGGAAVFRRVAGTVSSRPIAFTNVADGVCPTIEFTRVQLVEDTECVSLLGFAGRGRLLVSTGREQDRSAFEIASVSVDEEARRLTIRVRVGAVRSDGPPLSAPSKVIELPESIRGDWLVGVEPETPLPRPFGFATAFAVDLR